jgi:hypothetical protein
VVNHQIAMVFVGQAILCRLLTTDKDPERIVKEYQETQSLEFPVTRELAFSREQIQE